MAPSSPNVSAPRSASTLPRSQTSSATPTSPPDWRSTAPGTVKIPEPIVVPTTMRTRSRSVRTRELARVVPATSELAGNGFGHLCGRRLAADIRRAHPRRNRLLHGLLEVASGLRVAQLFEHQRTRQHGGHRVRDPFASERGPRAVHRLEQAGPTRVKGSRTRW